MRYILITNQDNIGREQEISLLQVGQIIQSETKDKNKTMEKILSLRKLGWVTFDDKTIEYRTY